MHDLGVSSLSDQINHRVDLLARLLKENGETIHLMRAIGVNLDIPMGVRQRLIQLHGHEARDWLKTSLGAVFETTEPNLPSVSQGSSFNFSNGKSPLADRDSP